MDQTFRIVAPAHQSPGMWALQWRLRARRVLPGVVWVCLVVAVAAYGAVVVRNVTETLTGISDHAHTVTLGNQPNR